MLQGKGVVLFGEGLGSQSGELKGVGGMVKGLDRSPAWGGSPCGTGEGKGRTGTSLHVPCGPGQDLGELLLLQDILD